ANAGTADRPRSYVLLRKGGERFFGHLPLTGVGQKAWRVLERQPAHLGDLVAERLAHRAEPAALVADEEERHDLEDPLALPVEPVTNVAELAEQASAHARLLLDLAERGRLAGLTLVDLSLR